MTKEIAFTSYFVYYDAYLQRINHVNLYLWYKQWLKKQQTQLMGRTYSLEFSY